MDERPDVPLTESEAERNSRTFRISQVREATDHAGYADEVTLEIYYNRLGKTSFSSPAYLVLRRRDLDKLFAEIFPSP